MKKIFVLAFAAISLVACNDETDATVETKDSTGTMTTTTSDNAYTAAEGDVTYRENKVMVMRNGSWVEADDEVRLDNGVVVYKDGRVTKDGKERNLEDGVVVTKTGNFFDRTGQSIENAWDATKEGVKEAGKEVKDATKKVGKEIKDAVDDDQKDN